MVVQACDPSTQEVEERRSEVQAVSAPYRGSRHWGACFEAQQQERIYGNVVDFAVLYKCERLLLT